MRLLLRNLSKSSVAAEDFYLIVAQGPAQGRGTFKHITGMQQNENTSSIKRIAVWVWAVSSFLLVGPSLLGWLVRLISSAAMCAPGPAPCTVVPFGGILQILLSVSWTMTGSSVVVLMLSLIATLGLFVQHRPMEGTISFFLLPIFALALPMLLVFVSKYDGCAINADNVGSCVLWGNAMGGSFHAAATVQRRLYDLMPHLAGFTVMLGLMGWFFARPGRRRVKPNDKMAMEMRQFMEPPSDDKP